MDSILEQMVLIENIELPSYPSIINITIMQTPKFAYN